MDAPPVYRTSERRRANNARWREKNRDHIKAFNATYYRNHDGKRRMMAKAERLAQRAAEQQRNQDAFLQSVESSVLP